MGSMGSITTVRTTSSFFNGSHLLTDPTYGIDSGYSGRRRYESGARTISRLYRFDPSGRLPFAFQRMTSSISSAWHSRPITGSFSTSRTRRTHVEDGPRTTQVFDVDAGRLSGGHVFAECPAGFFDGFRLDEADNVWTSAGDGVRCYSPDKTLIGIIRVPNVVANVCFGGPARNRLFICATGAVYAVYVLTSGIKLV